MSTTLTTVPGAGWYPDPADAGHWRWWDGAAWTDHTQVKATGPVTAPQDVALAAPAPEPPAAAPVPPNPAPVQPPPAPATPAATAVANAVPQPGTVVAAPGQPVSMTPTTPISDQLYWHSSAAEVIAVPRHHNPATSSIGPGARGGAGMPRYVVDWNDIGSPHTAGVWLLAFSPLISAVLTLGAGFAMGMAGVTDLNVTRYGLIGFVYLLLWSGAGLDIHALRERGYRPPRIWWMLLLPPLAYLIARGKSVRRESRRAWPPELVYVVNVLVVSATILLGTAWLVASGLLWTGA